MATGSSTHAEGARSPWNARYAGLDRRPSAFRFLWFLTFTIWPPTFTAHTRVQIRRERQISKD